MRDDVQYVCGFASGYPGGLGRYRSQIPAERWLNKLTFSLLIREEQTSHSLVTVIIKMLMLMAKILLIQEVTHGRRRVQLSGERGRKLTSRSIFPAGSTSRRTIPCIMHSIQVIGVISQVTKTGHQATMLTRSLPLPKCMALDN